MRPDRPSSGQDLRAISVPLARVTRGQPRLLPAIRLGRSAPLTAVTVPLPKLIVRVRFPSPAPLQNPSSAGRLSMALAPARVLLISTGH